MATRSAIGILKGGVGRSATVLGTYCHWDGYPSNNGRILIENYTTEDAVNELLAGGQISVLNKTVGTKHPFSSLDTEMSNEEYDELYGDMTVYYGRDRGEKDVDARLFGDVKQFVEHFEGAGCEYFYVYNPTNGMWAVNDHGNTDENGFLLFKELGEVVARELDSLRARGYEV